MRIGGFFLKNLGDIVDRYFGKSAMLVTTGIFFWTKKNTCCIYVYAASPHAGHCGSTSYICIRRLPSLTMYATENGACVKALLVATPRIHGSDSIVVLFWLAAATLNSYLNRTVKIRRYAHARVDVPESNHKLEYSSIVLASTISEFDTAD
jgi:hypothetical protein